MNRFSERLHADHAAGTIVDGERRYLMLRADVLMGLFHELPPALHQQALAALARSAQRHGGQSVQAYRLEEGGQQALLATMVSAAAALGWGAWDIAVHQDGVELRVLNSPFADGHGPATRPVCAPISGIFNSLAGALLGTGVVVAEYQCAAQGGDCCRFRASRPTTHF